MSEDTVNQEENVGIPINFRSLPRTPSFYSNRMVLQRGELGEIEITFFEIIQPIILGDSEEASEKFRAMGVNAESQVRIILPPKRFLDFAQLIAQQANKIVNGIIPASEQEKGE